MNKILKRIYLAIILIFLYAPIAVLMIFSFNESKSRGNWSGFSLKWYIALFSDRQIMSALYTTLLIAILSAVIATVIGTASAIGISSLSKWRRKMIMNITNLPVLNPDIVTGISLMLLYIFVFGLIGAGTLGFTTLLLAHITFNIPYVILSVLPKMRYLDNNLYEAALDLGAKPMYALVKVIIPELKPGIVSGFILAFTLSIDDFVISYFTSGNGVYNLSTVIYSMARKGINPKINAVSTIMFVMVMLLLYLINLNDARQVRTQNKEDI